MVYHSLLWSFSALALLSSVALAEPFKGYDTAVSINAEVSASRNYTPRIAKWYRPWRVIKPGEPGNCLDYAVLKCAMLRKAGFDASRLSLVAFPRWDGIGHAVCVIDGAWAMDWKNYPISATKAGLGALDEPIPVEVNAPWR
ncbi:transglutaminase domain-containing protein [Roseixanthobacter finlandensis]|uniref:transglutaminase domain-containing protein n=1 Tax=Roseixanthobacter finlandensis TaxID=3119922 RepID=UPI00372CF306